MQQKVGADNMPTTCKQHQTPLQSLANTYSWACNNENKVQQDTNEPIQSLIKPILEQAC